MSNQPMPMVPMLSLRSFRLASIKGHVIQFTANEPTPVPQECVLEAQARGCVPVNAADAPFIEDLERAKVEFTGDLRKSTIYLTVKALIEKNDTKDFDAGGVPKETVVSDRVGYDVAKSEVIDLFKLYQEMTSSGTDSFTLHPAAENVMRVVAAETRAELVELIVDEFKLCDAKQAKGMDVKTLRKFALQKFQG